MFKFITNIFKKYQIKKIKKNNVTPFALSLNDQVLMKIKDYDFLIKRRHEEMSIICKKTIVNWSENEEYESNILKKRIIERIEYYEIKKRLLLDLILNINNN